MLKAKTATVHQPVPEDLDVFTKCYNYNEVEAAKERGLYVPFRLVESGQHPEAIVEGRSMIMMGSNNYLGLTVHPRVIEAARQAASDYGTGCAGSRWLNGNHKIHLELERKLADLVGLDEALVYATGYQTNLGAIASVLGRGDLALVDKLDHASIIDAVNMSAGEMIRYRHNDMDHLEYILKKESDRPKLIITDGVFSMEGDLCDLPTIVELAQRYKARIFLDDAHGIGVLGTEGAGTADHFGVTEHVDLIMGTFSKSLASIGGFVAGKERVINWMKHFSRSLMFSAALPPILAAATAAAVDVCRDEPEVLRRLWANQKRFKSNLDNLGLNTGDTVTPIIPVIIGDHDRMLAMTSRLGQEGVFVNPVRSPAVPIGRELLRTSVMASHEFHHLDRAAEAIGRVARELGIIN